MIINKNTAYQVNLATPCRKELRETFEEDGWRAKDGNIHKKRWLRLSTLIGALASVLQALGSISNTIGKQ